MKPYVYKTTDYGQTWTALPAQESGVRGYAHVIKEDTVNPQCSVPGHGVRVVDFSRWRSTLGAIQGHRISRRSRCDDIVVQPRESDLVLATHGRGIWIIDDISPLRALTPDLMTKDATLLPGRPAMQYFEANGGWPEGDETFLGRNRPADAQITYYQKSRHIFGDLKIEILRSGRQVGRHGRGQQTSRA